MTEIKNSRASEKESVRLHKIGIEHVEFALRLIRERNSHIEYLEKSPKEGRNIEHTERSVQWCNEQIKSVLGI